MCRYLLQKKSTFEFFLVVNFLFNCTPGEAIIRCIFVLYVLPESLRYLSKVDSLNSHSTEQTIHCCCLQSYVMIKAVLFIHVS